MRRWALAFVLSGLVWAALRLRRPPEPDVADDRGRARRLLARAVSLVRLPTSPDLEPAVLADGSGLRCPRTERIYPFEGGVLDLLVAEGESTFAQKTLSSPLMSWAYDHFRGLLTRALGVPDFATDVSAVQQTLRARPGDVILDLACGPGNFTVEWAKRVGAEGLVIGLDIAPAMLARASHHVRRWGLGNVLLIRGDAQHLPFADGSLGKVNCSGGFHQFPDLDRAIAEIARVSAPGAVLTASTFAEGPDDRRAGAKRWLRRRFGLHFVPLPALGGQLAAAGYAEYRWSLPGAWFGYASARKTAGPGAAGGAGG